MYEVPERPADPEAIPSLAAFHAENISIMLRSVADQRAREREQKARRFPRRDGLRLVAPLRDDSIPGPGPYPYSPKEGA